MCLKSLRGALFSGLWCSNGGGLRSCTRGWVDVLRSCLWCHLYDPRFVNDASSAVSFLYNPDDPRLVALAVFWGFDFGTEAGSLLSRETDKQASYEEKEIWSQGSQILFFYVKWWWWELSSHTADLTCKDLSAAIDDQIIVVLQPRWH